MHKEVRTIKQLSIGEMAQLNHISEQTLRLYDKIGLLKPCFRGENNYRYYDICQCAVLDIIQHLKRLGMSLKEIKIHLENPEIDYLEEFLEKQQNIISYEIKELQIQSRGIERSIENLNRFQNMPPDGTIILEYIPRRMIYYMDIKENIYSYDLEVYGKMLKKLKKKACFDRLPQIYCWNMGKIIRNKYLFQKTFLSTELFFFVDNDFVSDKLIATIQPGNYLCIYCDNFYKEKDYINRLLNYIAEHDYKIVGDYLCETITGIRTRGEKDGEMALRLQVPISFY